ncbi:hypothetical protein PCASD_03858 [Puccinia coronata f. sp. avenae]|uniref:Uncharacterized protein n=1 Tax=Puccinia coronata f. sp. avenae TaxID=200324 RepID=A0A2N5V309_9BASI|nr:hypothetical protein PCASD_03858 [Puccinia coronata f. sp. avenae]
MFHPAPTRVISVPTLEQAATLSTTQFNVAAPTSNMPLPPPPPSAAGNNLSIVSKRSSRKGRKRLRTEPEDEERPRYPQPLEELLKMTVIQLKKVAADNSKHAMSAEDEQFFLDFYQEQEQMMAIKAIERGVSLPMVHAILKNGVQPLHAALERRAGAARLSPHAARHVHAYNRRAYGVQACQTGVQSLHACLKGVQSLHALRTGVQALQPVGSRKPLD